MKVREIYLIKVAMFLIIFLELNLKKKKKKLKLAVIIKALKENEFIEELYNFFVNKKNIINSIINELQEIIKFVQNHFCSFQQFRLQLTRCILLFLVYNF